MSLLYNMIEKSCFLINQHTGNLIKKGMYANFAKTDTREELSKYMYRKFSVTKVVYQDFPVFIIRNRNQKKHNRKAILFLAGGGGLCRPMAIHFDTVSRLIKETDATLYFAYYPLAPKHNVRDALTWLEGVYQAMMRRYMSRNITFIGDSAGANLALSLIYRVKNRPSKVIAISPAPGLRNGLDRDIRKNMEEKDPILNVAMNDLVAIYWAREVPLDSPDINPANIDYYNFPEILILYGTHELFYPHVKRLIQKMRQEGVMLEIIEKPMCHDWALCSFFAEGREAMKRMVDFI